MGRPKRGSHDTDLPGVEQGDKTGDDSGINHAPDREEQFTSNSLFIYVLDFLVGTVSQIGESPAGISKNLGGMRLHRISRKFSSIDLDLVASPLCLDAVWAGQGREGTALQLQKVERGSCSYESFGSNTGLWNQIVILPA